MDVSLWLEYVCLAVGDTPIRDFDVWIDNRLVEKKSLHENCVVWTVPLGYILPCGRMYKIRVIGRHSGSNVGVEKDLTVKPFGRENISHQRESISLLASVIYIPFERDIQQLPQCILKDIVPSPTRSLSSSEAACVVTTPPSVVTSSSSSPTSAVVPVPALKARTEVFWYPLSFTQYSRIQLPIFKTIKIGNSLKITATVGPRRGTVLFESEELPELLHIGSKQEQGGPRIHICLGEEDSLISPLHATLRFDEKRIFVHTISTYCCTLADGRLLKEQDEISYDTTLYFGKHSLKFEHDTHYDQPLEFRNLGNCGFGKRLLVLIDDSDVVYSGKVSNDIAIVFYKNTFTPTKFVKLGSVDDTIVVKEWKEGLSPTKIYEKFDGRSRCPDIWRSIVSCAKHEITNPGLNVLVFSSGKSSKSYKDISEVYIDAVKMAKLLNDMDFQGSISFIIPNNAHRSTLGRVFGDISMATGGSVFESQDCAHQLSKFVVPEYGFYDEKKHRIVQEYCDNILRDGNKCLIPSLHVLSCSGPLNNLYNNAQKLDIQKYNKESSFL